VTYTTVIVSKPTGPHESSLIPSQVKVFITELIDAETEYSASADTGALVASVLFNTSMKLSNDEFGTSRA